MDSFFSARLNTIYITKVYKILKKSKIIIDYNELVVQKTSSQKHLLLLKGFY